MPLPTLFGPLTNATGGELDANFATLGFFAVLPCTISGTNTLTLALFPNAPTVAAYGNFFIFAGIAVATNTGATTAAVGSLAALGVFKDTGSGPVALTGGEIHVGNYIRLVYDASLASGAGGFHLGAA